MLLCAALVPAAQATNHLLRMDEIMAALEGDPTIQFIEIVTGADSQKDWGPQGGETESRAMLVFFDGAGNQTAVFKFPNDPPNGGNTVLIATAAFTARTGLRADVTMPPLLQPGSGKVCFRGNPANPASFSVNLCLSYGEFPAGLTEGAGPPAPGLPASGQPTSLARFQNFSFGNSTSRNSDFILGSPSPMNTSGQTVSFPVPGPEISVVPALVGFGNRDVSLGPTSPRSITITSLGSSNPLVIARVLLSGPNAEQFRILSDSGQAVLGPNSSRVITVEFDPQTVGAKTATLRIDSNDSDEPTVSVVLQGGGIDTNPCAAPDPAVALGQDACAQAQLIGPGFTYSGSFDGATSDGFATCIIPAASDVWFRYVAASNGVLTVLASASQSQAVGVSAHSGCPGTSANQLACISPIATPTLPQSRFQLNVVAGAEVLLRVARVGGGDGIVGALPTYQLAITGPAAFDFDKNRNGLNDACEFDFGDAPAPYPTSLADNGARHRAVTGLFLGRRIDPNTNGIPSADATGDNLDGPANDDDGITWLTSIGRGFTATLQAVSSGAGFLNAWIDFNADGDWSDPGEQILTDRAVVAGTNLLIISVPIDAVFTNRTFARFRLNSTGGLGVTGSATDGEVEDYAIAITGLASLPNPIDVSINEVMAGLNGDSSVQFVKLTVGQDPFDRAWGPQEGETNGRQMLAFFDAAGRQTGRFVFPSNAPAGGTNILVATRALAELTGLAPDFIMPPEVVPNAGKVAFRSNPDNSFSPFEVSVAYGGAGYFGPTDRAGQANPAPLPVLGATSLHRSSIGILNGTPANPYEPRPPTPENTAGQALTLTDAPLIEQGRALFMKETFNGNGRTCVTCHRPGRDQFGLTPATIAALPDSDPLFVFEENINILRLSTRSQPGDLRERITGGSGSAQILAGSGDTYLVLGGGQLSGVIADTNGNSGPHADFTLGDLEGPTASNGSGRGLEDHELLRHGRGLILENIDGFTKREVFRASPHLMNIAQTAPYGLSGDFANLRDFAAGAVAQHFPRSLARVSGRDFREPTADELLALEAFMNSVATPANLDLTFEKFATTEAQKRGRALFFGNEAKCSKCHSGPTLVHSDGSLPGSVAGVNEKFDTGVANRAMNGPTGSNLPTEPAGLARGARKFNTPPLFGVRLTAPYFHDGSATNLRAAVEFYDGVEFVSSPSSPLAGPMPAVHDPEKVADLVAFLESLVDIPVGFTREATFGIRCGGGLSSGPMTVGVTNIGTNVLAIAKVTLVGSNSQDFYIARDSGERSLAPGQWRRIDVAFKPTSWGSKRATLEIAATDPGMPGAILFATALSGALVDNVVTAGPGSLRFAPQGIDGPPFPAQQVKHVNVTNTGSAPLEFVGVGVAGMHAGDFRISGDSGPTNLAPGGVRALDIAFAPQARGERSAVLHIESVACDGALIEVALSGSATSLLDHFEWAPIASPQGFNTAFPVRISAVDRNGELITGFTNAVNLSALAGPNPTNISASTILITELDPGNTDAMEFMNVSSAPVDVSGWQVFIIDQVAVTTPLTFTFPPGSIVAPGGLFTLAEAGVSPGSFPSFFTGFNISWVGAFSNLAVQVRNAQGALVDFATGSALGAGVFLSPTVPASEWSGGGFPTPAQEGVTSYQRIGSSDRNNASDWVIALLSMGAVNAGLSGAFANPARSVELSVTNTTPFASGVWTGEIAARTESVEVRLNVDDGAGHSGRSNPFDVVGTPPTISSLPNLNVLEDTPSQQVGFNVNDAETPPSALTVTATSSNPALVTPSGILLGGTTGLRTLRVQPATNQFGTADITVQVSDGSSSATRSFSLTVQPVNDPPVILPVGNRVVTERTAVSINVLAIDPDLPNDVLTFSLLQGPAGATIEPATGLIQWLPTELQGGTTFNFVVNVRDAAPGPPSVTNFLVQVLKVNNPPTFDPVPPQTVYAGGLLRFTITALDLDIPTNFLTFSLATNVPGTHISPIGEVTWIPSLGQVGLNLLHPVVRDNGSPPMSVTQAVSVLVVQPPMGFTTNVDFGTNCASNAGPALPGPQWVGITNTGATNLALLSAVFLGTNLAEFPVLSDTGQTNLAPGETRRIEIGFTPASLGRKAAILGLSATAGDPLGIFAFEVPITAAYVDAVPAFSVAAIDFGVRGIDDSQFPTQSVVLTNLGAGPLVIESFTLVATNSLEFVTVSPPPIGSTIPPGGTREWQFRFSPRSRGAKAAQFVLDTLACGNGHFEIPLTGVGTSTLDHFGWDSIAATQAVSVPFGVRVTAQDRNNQTVTEFTGPAALSAFINLPSPPPRVVISEIDPGTPDAVEFVNVSGQPINLGGWQIVLYDDFSFPSPAAILSLLGTNLLSSNGVFTVTEGGTAPGSLPNLFAGAILFWHETSTNIAVLLRDNTGAIVDFATTGDRTSITFPVSIPASQWSGPGIPAEALDEVLSYHRIGFSDHNDLGDWTLDARGIGALDAGLTVPFPATRMLGSLPAATGSFTNGVWAGSLRVLEEASQVRLLVDDGAGHATPSGFFIVQGTPPLLSDIPNQTLDEDTTSQVIQFSVSDPEQAAQTLVVTAVSSNVLVVENAGILLGGAGGVRTLRVTPVPNRFGVATITVSVSDGTQTTSKSFQVTVNPLPDPPFIPGIGSRQVNELQTLSFVINAVDPDPGSRLTFSLISAPAGASIQPTNGNFSWTPTEAQGPTNATIVLQVADDGVPSLTATQVFFVTVFEVNQPPVFQPVSNRVVHLGTILNVTNVVTDPDIPTNQLFFSVIQAPIGSTLDTRGLFSFMPTPSQVGSNFLVRLRVADSGAPSLVATQTFSILVLPSPVSQPARVDFGSNCLAAFPLPTQVASFTNISTNPVTFASVTLTGSAAGQFFLADDTGETVLLPGQSRSVRVGFNPSSAGFWSAALVLVGTHPQGPVTVSVPVGGMLRDNTASVAPAALQFGAWDIDQGLSNPQFFMLSNSGPVLLNGIRARVSAGDTNDFQVTSDPGNITISPGGTLSIGVAFRPTRRGPRAATLTVESAACSGAMLEVALTGTGTSMLHHFSWDAVPSPQAPGAFFSVRVRAVDRNDELITNFTGSVRMSAFGTTDVLPVKPVLLTEIDIGTEAVEFMNVSGQPVDLSGWRVLMYETPIAPTAILIIPSGSILGSNSLFTVTELGTPPGTLPSLFTGTGVGWNNNSTNLAVVLLDAEGGVVDFATLDSITPILNPVDIPAAHWRGPGIAPGAVEFSTSYQRQGYIDRNDSSDWRVGPRTMGGPNTNLARVFLSANTNATVRVAPTNSTAFVSGEWSGTVAVLDEARTVRLRADDGAAHTGLSGAFDVFGQPPFISDITDLTVDEDTTIPTVTFSIGDDFVPAANLIVFARSSDTNFLPDSRIVVLGNGNSRNLRITLATNQFGSTTITVTVSDGAQSSSDSFLLTVRPVNDPPVMLLGAALGDSFRENFDSVTPPALPPGWVGVSSAGIPWQTVNTSSDTSSNSVFFPDPMFTTDNSLTSPTIFLRLVPTNLTFRHSFTTESCCDGGFLEASTNGSPFSNVTALGWIFTAGGYNSTDSWRGSSGGFITTTLALPMAVANQALRFRWRFTSDSTQAGTGWFIDSISAGSTGPTNLTANEDVPISFIVPVSDAETPAGALVLTVTSLSPTLVPQANILLGGGASERLVTVIPATNQSGNATVLLALSDGQRSVTQPLNLTFLPVNDPPSFVPVPDQFIDEGSTLEVRLSASDPDLGTNRITFTPMRMPGGATLNQTSGVVRWTPAETQGPGFHTFTVSASDNASPPATASQSFLVFVREVNSAPFFEPWTGLRQAYVGFPLAFVPCAMDADFPANNLTFSLDTPIAGATVQTWVGNANCAAIIWTPDVQQIGTNILLLRATDNGNPPLSGTISIPIEVRPAVLHVSIHTFGGNPVISWDGLFGRTYRVEFTPQLDPPTWQDLGEDQTGTSMFDFNSGSTQRFYRVKIVR